MRCIRLRLLVGLFLIFGSLPILGGAKTVEAASVHPMVRQSLARSNKAQFWIILKEKADLGQAMSVTGRDARRRAVVKSLKEVAAQSQAALKVALKQRNVTFKSYFIINALLVTGDANLLSWLSAHPDVARIAPNPRMKLLHSPVARQAAGEKGDTIEWNLATIRAPEAWAAGYRGEGVVVAGADTGVDWTHSAIRRQYRGSIDSGIDHNYNWFDAINGHSDPYDDNAHGTFTMGEMVGDDGAGNQIGVAPDARWIGCKNMDAAGYGSPETYIDCFQWFVSPTDSQGRNSDPGKAPDIINNSWSCPVVEGCDAETLHEIIGVVQSAGIMLVFSAGNEGPECGSVAEPVAMYPEVLSIGATDQSDQIASFSSRGPSAYDRGAKPNVSAPGSNVRSSVPGNGYSSMSGTSMASPLVVGAVALVWSADASRIGDIEGTSSLLEDTARYRRGRPCGAGRGQNFNNTYGYGIIDVKSAVDSVR